MTLSELIAAFRDETRDNVEPYLWSDKAITRWLNEAEREACIRARLIYDDTTDAIAKIAVTAGETEHELDMSVQFIKWARYVDSAVYQLAIKDVNWLDEHVHNWQDYGGSPRYLLVEGNFVRIIGAPTEDGELELGVYRTPKEVMEDDGDAPEIAERHHEALLYWVKHRAYLVPDTDTYDNDRAMQMDAYFTSYFGQRRTARAHINTARHREPTVKSSW
jgi:hypothetical protein